MGSAQLRLIQGGFSPGEAAPWRWEWLVGSQTLSQGSPALSAAPRSSLRELTGASLTLNLNGSLSKTFLCQNARICGWQSWDGFVEGVHFPGRVSGRAFVPQGLLSSCQKIKGGFVNSFVENSTNTGKTKCK